MSTPVTLNVLDTNFKDYVQAQNANTNPYAINSFWDVVAGAVSGQFLDLYFNLDLVINSIYVQNSVGDQCDKALYAEGLPARGGLTYGILQFTVPTGTPVTIPANTVFTDSSTGNRFQNYVDITVPDDTTINSLYAIVAGNTSLEPIGNTLTGDSITIQVSNATNGQLEESDASCINRLLQARRAPIAGARSTDYQIYALRSNVLLPVPTITGSIPIPSFFYQDGVNRLGLFVTSGAPITEYQLNQGLLPSTSFTQYSRESDAAAINAANVYIQSLRLVGTAPIVGTCITQPLSPLTITVNVLTQYSGNTPITLESQDINGNPISITLTVTQIIQRELRRAICNQPFGATTIGSANFITVENLYTAMNNQLSYQDGALLQLITNMVIAGGDISVPYYTDNPDNVYYAYDFNAYSDITVVVS